MQISTVASDAVKIEEVLKDVPDRSVWIDYEGVMTATTRTDYFSECECSSYPYTLHLRQCRSSKIKSVGLL